MEIPLCTLLCDIPLPVPAPLYCLQHCAIYFPHAPLFIIAIKYWQYLVRAKLKLELEPVELPGPLCL